MTKRPFIVFGIFAVVFGLLIPWMALSKDGDGDDSLASVPASLREARTLFQDNCGSCHTLAKAATDGVVGPNLDELLGASAPEASKSRVANAIRTGAGQGKMPAGIMAGDDAEEVARFVSRVAGKRR